MGSETGLKPDQNQAEPYQAPNARPVFLLFLVGLALVFVAAFLLFLVGLALVSVSPFLLFLASLALALVACFFRRPRPLCRLFFRRP